MVPVMSQAVEAPAPAVIDYDVWRRRVRQDTFARYHLGMADALRTAGTPEEAIAAYRRAIAEMPDLKEAYFNLVDFLRENGRDREAEETHQAALAACPGYDVDTLLELCKAEILQRGKDNEWPRLAKTASRLVDLAVNDSVAAAYGALSLLYVGDLEKGLTAFAAARERLGEAPENLVADYTEVARRRLWETEWHGRITWRDDTLSTGLAMLDCARKLAPRNDALLSTHLSVLLFQYRPKELLKAAAETYNGPAWSPTSALFTAQAYLQLGCWDDAGAELQAALPSTTDAVMQDFMLSGIAYARLGKGDIAGALEAVTTPANSFAAHTTRLQGLILLGQGRPAEALSMIAAAQAKLPMLEGWTADIALCHQAQGDCQKAESLCRQALAAAGVKTRYLSVDDPWIHLSLALALDGQGRTREADEIFRNKLGTRSDLIPGLLPLLPAWGHGFINRNLQQD